MLCRFSRCFISFLSFLMVYMLSFPLYAQKDSVTQAIVAEENIILIPFDPTQVHSSGEYFILKSGDITANQFVGRIRSDFYSAVNEYMQDDYNIINIFRTKSKERQADLRKLYQITSYDEIMQPVKAYVPNKPPFKLALTKNDRWGTDCISATENTPDARKHRYARPKFNDSIAVRNISKKYNAGYFLFIDHFEMATRYSNCLDMQRNVFQRDLFVHYAIMDADGKFVDGGVVGTTYESNTNDLQTIIDYNFTNLAFMLIDEVVKIIE